MAARAAPGLSHPDPRTDPTPPSAPDVVPVAAHNHAADPAGDSPADLDASLGRHQLQSLTLAPVRDVGVRPQHTVDAATDVVSVVRLFRAERTTQVLVRVSGNGGDRPGLGIFTTSDLQRAILDARPPPQLAVGLLASQPLVTVGLDTPVYDALALTIRHRVQRLVVLQGDAGRLPAAPTEADVVGVVGVLEQPDLLRFLSSHSDLVTRQILDATDLAALEAAAHQITRVIGLMHGSGTRVELIARLVQALNAQLFERAWQLVAPPGLVANSCLFVMGSEGRGEQLLKTDQDNGLVLRDATCRRPIWTPSASDSARRCRASATRHAAVASCSATPTGATAPASSSRWCGAGCCCPRRNDCWRWPSSWTHTRCVATPACWPRCVTRCGPWWSTTTRCWTTLPRW